MRVVTDGSVRAAALVRRGSHSEKVITSANNMSPLSHHYSFFRIVIIDIVVILIIY